MTYVAKEPAVPQKPNEKSRDVDYELDFQPLPIVGARTSFKSLREELHAMREGIQKVSEQIKLEDAERLLLTEQIAHLHMEKTQIFVACVRQDEGERDRQNCSKNLAIKNEEDEAILHALVCDAEKLGACMDALDVQISCARKAIRDNEIQLQKLDAELSRCDLPAEKIRRACSQVVRALQ